jgi:hypothetical protein
VGIARSSTRYAIPSCRRHGSKISGGTRFNRSGNDSEIAFPQLPWRLPEAPGGQLTEMPRPASLACLRAIGGQDRAAQSDTGAIEHVLRRRLRRAHHGAGVWLVRHVSLNDGAMLKQKPLPSTNTAYLIECAPLHLTRSLIADFSS